jgi:hypothetical protein
MKKGIAPPPRPVTKDSLVSTEGETENEGEEEEDGGAGDLEETQVDERPISILQDIQVS